MKLALALHKTLKELRRDIGGSKEIALWKAFDVVEPFGAYRDDWRIANLCELYANLHYRKFNGKFTLEDFIYQYKHKEVTVEEAVKMMDIAALTAKLHAFFKTTPPN